MHWWEPPPRTMLLKHPLPIPSPDDATPGPCFPPQRLFCPPPPPPKKNYAMNFMKVFLTGLIENEIFSSNFYWNSFSFEQNILHAFWTVNMLKNNRFCDSKQEAVDFIKNPWLNKENSVNKLHICSINWRHLGIKFQIWFGTFLLQFRLLKKIGRGRKNLHPFPPRALSYWWEVVLRENGMNLLKMPCWAVSCW